LGNANWETPIGERQLGTGFFGIDVKWVSNGDRFFLAFTYKQAGMPNGDAKWGQVLFGIYLQTGRNAKWYLSPIWHCQKEPVPNLPNLAPT
jgi:hypothetical protein